MTDLMPFRNNDAQGIVEVWNGQIPLRGRLRGMTASLFEQHVLAKPYFDPAALIVSHDNSKVTGFVHVGYAPGSRPGEFDRRRGFIWQLQVAPSAEQASIADRLLAAGEACLKADVAAEFVAGGLCDQAPFYLGLYGGACLPGVLHSDSVLVAALQRAGYEANREMVVLQRELATFRPPIDRTCLGLRRRYNLQAIAGWPDDLRAGDWLDRCAFAWVDRTRFRVLAAADGSEVGYLDFWDMEPLASSWKVRASGLVTATFANDSLRGELLPCFLADALKQLQTEGVAIAEVVSEMSDSALRDSCTKLGFREVDRGTQWIKRGMS